MLCYQIKSFGSSWEEDVDIPNLLQTDMKSLGDQSDTSASGSDLTMQERYLVDIAAAGLLNVPLSVIQGNSEWLGLHQWPGLQKHSFAVRISCSLW